MFREYKFCWNQLKMLNLHKNMYAFTRSHIRKGSRVVQTIFYKKKLLFFMLIFLSSLLFS